MAIIYTYPTLSSASSADLILLTKASTKATSQITVDNLKDSLGVIDTITATSPIQVSLGNHSAALSLTTVPTSLGGTGLTTIGSAGQFLVVNSAGNGLEYINQTFIDGSGTTNYLPLFTDSDTLGDSIMYQSGSNLVIPQYIEHNGDAGSKFGFNANDGFLVYLGGTGATERLQLQTDSFLVRTGDSTKISANATNASLYYEPSTSTNSHIVLTSSLDGALLKGEINVNPGKLRLYSSSQNSYVGLRGSTDPLASTYTLQMPNDVGTIGQVLKLGTPGPTTVLEWGDGGTAANPGGSATQMQYNVGGTTFGGTVGLVWDDTTNILSIDTRYEGDINGAILQQVLVKEPGGVSKGDVVYISGGTGDNPEVRKAQANSISTMAALGIMKANTAEDAVGECVTSGEITGLNLTGFTTGDELFVSNTVAGGLQTSAPTGEANLIQKISKVIKGGSGGALTVLGAFRTNATPNLDQGSLFIGNASDQATTLGIGNNETVLTSDGTTASWETQSNLANADQTLTGQRSIRVGSNQLLFTAPSPVGSSQVIFQPKTTFAETANFQSKISPGQHNITTTSGSVQMSPADGMVQKLTLAGNVTFSIGVGASNGDEFTLLVTRTLATANITWSGIIWDNNDTDPGQTNIAGRFDIYKIIIVDSNKFGRVAALNYPVSF
jgi:hypothetical protein